MQTLFADLGITASAAGIDNLLSIRIPQAPRQRAGWH
jgi:hypothetical protein